MISFADWKKPATCGGGKKPKCRESSAKTEGIWLTMTLTNEISSFLKTTGIGV
ncbi:MAG: hypothetical protein BROFUL_01181 [Candidatus Brocadia fulgida]|uniref:Uncharacterized protein n=1 Tax=Candidatus Brocadia fulgida TaxID=380242 RepID=A0A0M2UYS1_9BACT|nr:MAG: hypothetical protein BROFUL_01181 [Candidatus Brocadia fulgida]MBV6519841.1 hypothetical protein [Candidatus Brocadia fulgida]